MMRKPKRWLLAIVMRRIFKKEVDDGHGQGKRCCNQRTEAR